MNDTIEIIPMLGLSLDNLMLNYQLFISSDNKLEKIKRLHDVQLSAIDIYRGTKQLISLMSNKLIGTGPKVEAILNNAVKSVTGNNIHMQILNLNHLATAFMVGEKPPSGIPEQEWVQEKLQLLYQMNRLSNDIAEIAVITNAEPDKDTERG